MPLSITSTVEDNFAILALAGPLTLSPSLNTLRQAARQALTARLAGLILQVAEVTLADSAGVGELTVIYTFATRSGCPLILVAVPPALKNILEITRLDALLPSANDLAEAKKRLKR